jgi:hypothetical protein
MTLACGAALALVASAVPAAAPPASGAKRPSCASEGSSTVLQNSRMRVFAKRVGKTVRWYGCLRTEGRKWLLARQPAGKAARGYAFDLPTYRNGYLGFAERGYDGRPGTRITVIDLRTGRVRLRSTQTKGEGSARAWTTTALVVTSSGAAAWIDRNDYDASTTEVRARDASGDVLIDRGQIHPRFLRVHGETITWLMPDGTRSTTLETATRAPSDPAGGGEPQAPAASDTTRSTSSTRGASS